MKLLVINPNISASVSELIRAEAERAATPGTEVVMRTAAFGVEYIETRFEALIGAYATAQILAEEHAAVDGVVVAAFGDPGMPALREFADIPVVGIAEAAMHTALQLGNRVGIIAISTRITAWYREAIDALGLGSRIATIRHLDEPIPDIGAVQTRARARLLELAWASVTEDGSDVVVLAGAPLAGLARTIVDDLPVPVVDGISAGVRQAELLVRTAPVAHRAGSFAPPPVKRNVGLSPEIARMLEQRD